MEKETKSKKSILKKWWFWLIIAFVLIVIIAGCGNKEEEITPEVTPNKVVETSEEIPVPTKEWTKVIKLTANTNKQSETFYLLGGQQKVLYSVSDTPFAICAIYVMKEGTDLMTQGGFPIVMADGDSTDETMMRKSKGNYYLDLQIANASCIVEIYEFK